MTKGKIVLVPFPFDDLSASKVRPAMCLTEPFGRYRHIVLAFITSRIPSEPGDTDLILTPSSSGFEQAGLKVASSILLHRLLTVSTSVIVRELGRLTPDLQVQINDRLRQLFQL